MVLGATEFFSKELITGLKLMSRTLVLSLLGLVYYERKVIKKCYDHEAFSSICVAYYA
jgi:hypothetical protein